jgi:hypothetical protein
MSEHPPYAVQTVQRGTHSSFDMVVAMAFLLLVALVLLPVW